MVTFTIAMVFLIMQFLWMYIDDIMGKDVGMIVVFKLLFYTSANVIPMALPIAVLFSSIMTMGNLAESNELTAMKSAGMSLFKVMRPMFLFVLVISILTFYFSNYILPIANLKRRALIYDLQQQKPTLSIPKGIFYNDIKGLSIRVDDKDKETGELIGVLIYTGNPLRTVRAERGEMINSENNQYLFLKLTNGSMYEETKLDIDKNVKYAYNKSFFKESIVKFDLSEFNLQQTNEDLYRRDYEMMNFIQLGRMLDTISFETDSLMFDYKSKIKKNIFIFRDTIKGHEVKPNKDDKEIVLNNISSIQLDTLDKVLYMKALKFAQVSIRSRKDFAHMYLRQSDSRVELIDDYKTSWHKKFTLSFAIVILFFIGAPLGAIVKKGGLGVPLVLATLLFLFYYIITITGENLVESNVLTPLAGIWLSALFLVPIGMFLTYKSANESALFDIDSYKRLFSKLKFNKK